MATRYYSKLAQYSLPAWNPTYFCVDGIYIDSDFFKNNTIILDSKLHIFIKPTAWHIASHQIIFSLASYNNGVVSMIPKSFAWLSGQDHQQNGIISCNGHPYGMGLNVIGVFIQSGPPIANPIIYDVSFTMEVTV